MHYPSTPLPAPRPEKRKEVPVRFRVCEELALDMDRIVVRERMTRSDFLREAILEKLSREAA